MILVAIVYGCIAVRMCNFPIAAICSYIYIYIVRGLSVWAHMRLQCIHLLCGRQTRDSAYHPTTRVSS